MKYSAMKVVWKVYFMTLPLPVYTGLDHPENGRGQDHLGLESVAINIQTILLSGITTITPRARYYAFYSWVLRDFRQTHPDRSARAFGPFLKQCEMAFILANLAVGPTTGLLGVTRGETVWSEVANDENAILDFDNYLKAPLGGYGQNYRNTLIDLHLTYGGEDGKADQLLDPMGERLAAAYEKSIAHTEYCRRYRYAREIPVRALRELGQFGGLDSMRLATSTDRDVLREVFFRFDRDEPAMVFRRLSLSYFLDLVRQCPGQPIDWRTSRPLMFHRRGRDGRSLSVPKEILAAASGWRMFHLRQYYVFGVEAIFAYLLQRLSQCPASLETVLSELDELVPGEAAEAAGFGAIRLPLARLPLGQLLAALERGVADEEPLVRLIERGDGAESLIGGGVMLLVLVYSRVKMVRATLLLEHAYCGAGSRAGRLPLDHFAADMDGLLARGATCQDLVALLMDRYVVRQHRRVAMEKLAAGEDTFRFMDQGGQLYYLHGDFPKFNGFRGVNALRMLADMALIEPSGSGWAITRDGEQMLKAALQAKTPPPESLSDLARSVL